MVFNSVSESETPHSSSSMASSFSPAKSQPLHNFPLNLKWSSMNHSKSNTQRFRRPNLDPTHQQSNNHPLNNKDNNNHRSGFSKNENRLIKLSYPTPISNSSRVELKNEIHSSKLKLKMEEKEKVKVKVKVKASHSHQTVLIRLPPRSKAASASTTDVDDETLSADEMSKTWNLRPRRLVTKQPPNNANVQDSIRPNELIEEKDAYKRQSLSVSLSKEEIEKDFLLMTGSKPSKRPKKRAKSVQRQLDVLSPGLWLTSVTPDLYRVPDPPLKG